VDCSTIEDEGRMGMGSYIRQLGNWSAPEAGYVLEQIHVKFTQGICIISHIFTRHVFRLCLATDVKLIHHIFILEAE
jgi:hypothetical protein